VTTRCAFAAVAHQVKSWANVANARSRNFPAGPVGSLRSFNASVMGPTDKALDMTTMPISDNIPCQDKAERTPDNLPAE
jgi:hypothetical protein